jgi:hypothetical protein
MNFKESKKKIYETTDYDAFIFPDWNRDVSGARVVKMVESIQSVGWLPEPVLVNDKFEVIDGQSRVKALQKLGMPVEFCIVHGIGRKECQNLNRFQKNWSAMNYIDSYASDGNNNYVWLKAMLKKYKIITNNTIFTLAVSGGSDSNIGAADHYKILESGLLNITDRDRKKAEDAMFYLARFAETSTYLGGRKDKFYSALMFLYLLDGIDNERLCKVINNARYDGIVASSTVEGYLQQFEILYNKGMSKAKRIDIMHEYKVA